MARPLRIDFPGAFHHVINRGWHRQKIFLENADYEMFLRTLAETQRLYGLQIYAFCLMGNHYHLLVQSEEGKLSLAIRHLNGIYALRFNRKYGLDGAVFRGRFRSMAIGGEAYFLEVLRYIHLNPVRAKLVKRAEDFRWSSHGDYSQAGARWGRWVCIEENFVLSLFHPHDLGKARSDYRNFITAGTDEALVSKIESAPSIFAPADILESSAVNDAREAEVNRLKILKSKPSELTVRNILLRLTNAKSFDDFTRKTSERRMAVFAYRHLLGRSHQEIADLFKIRTVQSVSRILKQLATHGNAIKQFEALKVEVAKGKGKT